MDPYDAAIIGTSRALDESVGPVAALASPASGAASAGTLLALESSIGAGNPPYGGVNTGEELAQSVVATAAPIAPAAKRAARDKRPAIVRVGPISTLALQKGQIASPRLT